MSDFEGNEKKTGYSFDDFMEDEIREASVKVSLFPHRFMAHFFLIIAPVIFYVMFYGFFALLEATDMSQASNAVKLVLFLTLLFGVFIFLRNCGKEIVISGRGIVFRRYFFLYESVNVSEVSRCEVITGLTTSGRYHHETYSMAVIHYGDGKKISVEDNLYRGWNSLVRYMEMNGKVIRIDGKGFISKKLDDLLNK